MKKALSVFAAIAAIMPNHAEAAGTFYQTNCYFTDSSSTQAKVFKCYVHTYGDHALTSAAIWKGRWGSEPVYAFIQQASNTPNGRVVNTKYYKGIGTPIENGSIAYCAEVSTKQKICYIWKDAIYLNDEAPAYPAQSMK